MPLSATEITTKISPKIDLVTVYRILELFEKARLARRVELRAGKALYEYGAHHHHHIVCTDCGAMEDVDACVPESTSRGVAAHSRSFSKINSHALEFFGTCVNCI